MNKPLVVLGVGMLLVVAGMPAFAAHQDILGRAVPDSTAESWGRVHSSETTSETAGATGLMQETLSQMGLKLGRGLVNASTGWVEWPKAIYALNEEWDPLFSLLVGSMHGVEVATVRTLAGVYETATFPVPLPAGYAPLVMPPSAFTWEGLSLRGLR